MSGATVVRTLVSAAVIATMISMGTACSSGTSERADPATTTASTTAGTVPFTGFIESADGTAGVVTYKAELPQLRGGDSAVRDKFNSTMRAALDDYLKPTEDNVPVTVAPGVLGGDDRSEVSHIGNGAVAGVLLLNIFVDHAAHPFNAVSTTVIDAHTAEPITTPSCSPTRAPG